MPVSIFIGEGRLFFGLFLSPLLALYRVLSPMQGSDNEMPPQPQPSSFSYVYPVKSLLTDIQPAPPTRSRPSVPRSNSSHVGDIVALQGLLAHQLAGMRGGSTTGAEEVPSHPMPPWSHPVLYPYPSRTATAGPSDVSEERTREASDPFSPRMQPIDSQSSLPISFTEAASPLTTLPVSGSSGPLVPPQLDLSASRDPPVDTTPTSSVHSVDLGISHISQLGIVHLPQLSPAPGPSWADSRRSASHTNSSSRDYLPSTTGNASSRGMHRVSETRDEEGKARDVSSRSTLDLKSVESTVESDFFATRCHHETAGNVNPAVIGQEDGIRRCEDEVRAS